MNEQLPQDDQLNEEADEYEAQQWEREMAQLRWAEAGGYAAGLPRPLTTRRA